MLICPSCHSGKIKKNGLTHYQKQNHKCKDCGRQFVLNNTRHISSEKRKCIKGCLGERTSLRGICRSHGVSLTWLMSFAVAEWSLTPDDLGVDQEALEKIDVKQLKMIRLQADEMWSFVGRKTNKQWIWVVYSPGHKKVLAFHVGCRGAKSARCLWNKLPRLLQENCHFETDYWEAYKTVITEDHHTTSKAVTYFIEGYFAGVRARVSRLVRKSLSFSKKLENHIAAIGYFLWQRNLGT